MRNEHAQYGWQNAEQDCSHDYLLPQVVGQIGALYGGRAIRILDVGCGNGCVAAELAKLGHSVVGVDASPDGISIARAAYPDVRFEVCSVYDDGLLAAAEPGVDCVISLEVVEHLFYPKRLFEQSYRVLGEGGRMIVSTPYHGYLKNLALSLLGAWDRHFHVDWDGGHIKFFSEKTLTRMALEAGFKNPRFHNVGRLPWLWKSMVMVVEK